MKIDRYVRLAYAFNFNNCLRFFFFFHFLNLEWNDTWGLIDVGVAVDLVWGLLNDFLILIRIKEMFGLVHWLRK
jgi:hypothetical protein